MSRFQRLKNIGTLLPGVSPLAFTCHAFGVFFDHAFGAFIDFAFGFVNRIVVYQITRESETHDMPQSLSSVLIHLIFSTKNREPLITPAIEAELHPYMASIFRELKSPTLALDGTSDHIHTLFSLSRVVTIADVVKEVKAESSKWIKTKGPRFKNFHWQAGYGAFSIGQSGVRDLKRYIRSQKQHHKRITYQDEFRKFLKSYEIEFDERYVWD